MWHDLLTPSVNVPAERAKLRRLRDEIAAHVEQREAEQRKYGFRGYLRNLQALATQGQPSNGTSPHGAVRLGASLDVPATAAHMREAQAGSARSSGSACGLAGEGVSA